MVPASTEARAAPAQPFALLVGAGEVLRVRQQARQLGLAPEEHAHVEAARRGTVEDVEDRAATVRELRVVIDERDRSPTRDGAPPRRPRRCGGRPARRRSAAAPGCRRGADTIPCGRARSRSSQRVLPRPAARRCRARSVPERRRSSPNVASPAAARRSAGRIHPDTGAAGRRARAARCRAPGSAAAACWRRRRRRARRPCLARRARTRATARGCGPDARRRRRSRRRTGPSDPS